MNTIETLDTSPFKRLVITIGALPTAFMDSMSYYEALAWLVDYIEHTIIPAIDNNAEILNELETAFIQLKQYVDDYFTNLDVQEEINNKLDEMAESGQLADIIAAYLQLNGILAYDSVASMKTATNLVDGSFAETYGFYNIGDNGGAKYKIREITNQDVIDESKIIALADENLVAELIINDDMNIAQFGAKGDGVTDESAIINIALASKGNDYLKLNFNNSGVYLAQQEVILYSNTTIDLQGATIKTCYDGDAHSEYVVFAQGLRIMNNRESLTTAGYGAVKNITITNGTFDGDATGVSIFLIHAENVLINKIHFKDCCVGGHVIDFGGCKDVLIEDCFFDGFLIDVDANYYREMIQFDYANKSNVPYWGDGAGYQYDNIPCINFTVNRCEFSKGSGRFYPTCVGGHNNNDGVFENIKITNCVFDDTSFASIRIPKAKGVTISGNTFNLNKLTTNRYGIYVRQTQALTDYTIAPTEDVTISNNIFNIDRCGAILVQGFTYEDELEVTQTVNYKNINIIDNICTGTYTSDNAYNNSFVDCAYTQIRLKSNNVYKCSWVLQKISGASLDKVDVIDNQMFYCYDFLHAVGSDTAPAVTSYQSNNIWTDNTGTININNFKAKVWSSSVYTSDELAYKTVPLSNTDNPFVTIIAENNYTVKLPNFIKRFKISGKIYYLGKTATSLNKMVRTRYYSSAGDAIADIAYAYVPQNGSTSINITPVIYDDKTFAYNTPKVGVQSYMPQNDQIGYNFGAFNQMTYIEIEGF